MPDAHVLSAPQDDMLFQAKQHIRHDMLTKRRSMPEEQRQILANQAAHLLMASSLWRQAGRVALYMAMPDEADTEQLLLDAWRSGKQLYLPRCSAGQQGSMDFVLCSSYEHIAAGSFNLQEPCPNRCTTLLRPSTGKQEPCCFIIPGVAFDRQGYRLGMGGGYYDRFLQPYERTVHTFVGFCFQEQVVHNLPHAPHDIPMHALCTETGVHMCAQ